MPWRPIGIPFWETTTPKPKKGPASQRISSNRKLMEIWILMSIFDFHQFFIRWAGHFFGSGVVVSQKGSPKGSPLWPLWPWGSNQLNSNVKTVQIMQESYKVSIKCICGLCYSLWNFLGLFYFFWGPVVCRNHMCEQSSGSRLSVVWQSSGF